MNSISFQEILAAITIPSVLYVYCRFIYNHRDVINASAMRLEQWGKRPIAMFRVRFLIITPASVIKFVMKRLIEVGRILYNVYIMLLAAYIIAIGKNEHAIQLAMIFFAIAFLFGLFMFKHFRIEDNEEHSLSTRA